VSDYISGMTDRFALQIHQRLIGGTDIGTVNGPNSLNFGA
jgi:hypothetical protein